MYEKKIENFETLKILLHKNFESILVKKEHDLQFTIQTLKLVNPLSILEKGYSFVKKDGQFVTDSSKINVKDELEITFFKGNAKVEVKEIN